MNTFFFKYIALVLLSIYTKKTDPRQFSHEAKRYGYHTSINYLYDKDSNFVATDVILSKHDTIKIKGGAVVVSEFVYFLPDSLNKKDYHFSKTFLP